MKQISFAFLVCILVALRSEAGINSWTSIGPPLPEFTEIQSVTIDPSNPDNLWVLTSGGLPDLWRSRDGGASWELMTDSTLAGALRIDEVEVDVGDSRHIFARGVLGFCVSFDGGDTWALHRIGNESSSFLSGGRFAVAGDSFCANSRTLVRFGSTALMPALAQPSIAVLKSNLSALASCMQTNMPPDDRVACSTAGAAASITNSRRSITAPILQARQSGV